MSQTKDLKTALAPTNRPFTKPGDVHIHVPTLEVKSEGTAQAIAAMQAFANNVTSVFAAAIEQNTKTLKALEAQHAAMIAALEKLTGMVQPTPAPVAERSAKRSYSVAFNRDDEGITGMRVVARDS